MNELPERVREMLTRRSMPTFDERILMQHIAKKVERAFKQLGAVEAGGAQAVLRCNGVVCREGVKRYVETGLVGIDLPKFGSDDLYDRLNGNFVN